MSINPEPVLTLQVEGVLAAGTNKVKFRMPCAGKITGLSAAVTTAPATTALILDLNKGATTMYTTQANRPTIAIDGVSAVAVLPDVVAFADGDILSLDLDQVGTTTTGAGLVVLITYAGVAG